MSAKIIPLRIPRTLTHAERMQSLLLAEMNQERAELCSKDLPGLRKLFEMNAQFLRSLAHDRTVSPFSNAGSKGTAAATPKNAPAAVSTVRSSVSEMTLVIHTERMHKALHSLMQAGFSVSNTGIVNLFSVEDAKEKT